MTDYVNHPPHYGGNPEGIECIQVTRHLNFNLGNAIKYLWRVDDKDDPVENLEKAIWYIKDEIGRRQAEKERALCYLMDMDGDTWVHDGVGDPWSGDSHWRLYRFCGNLVGPDGGLVITLRELREGLSPLIPATE